MYSCDVQSEFSVAFIVFSVTPDSLLKKHFFLSAMLKTVAV